MLQIAIFRPVSGALQRNDRRRMTIGCGEDEGVFVMSSSVANGDIHRDIYVHSHYSVQPCFPLLVSNNRLISQDDENSKEKCIADMDLTYSQSNSGGAWRRNYWWCRGIPGVRSESRKTRQVMSKIDHSLSLMAQLNFRYYQSRSVYNTRSQKYENSIRARSPIFGKAS